jgi:hypothetical protein
MRHRVTTIYQVPTVLPLCEITDCRGNCRTVAIPTTCAEFSPVEAEHAAAARSVDRVDTWAVREATP